MKLLLITLLCLPTFLISKSNYQSATLVYNTGKEIETLLKFPLNNNKKHIVIKKSEDSKSEKVKLNDLKKILMTLGDEDLVFHVSSYKYFITKKRQKTSKHASMYLELDKCEDMTFLFYADKFDFDPENGEFNSKSFTNNRSLDIVSFGFLLQRPDEEVPFFFEEFVGNVIGKHKLMKKRFNHYFKDNPEILKYLEDNKENEVHQLYSMICTEYSGEN